MTEFDPLDNIDWSLATWEGSRREQLRRWAELPLERMIAALEEMEDIANQLSGSDDDSSASNPRSEAPAPD